MVDVTAIFSFVPLLKPLKALVTAPAVDADVVVNEFAAIVPDAAGDEDSNNDVSGDTLYIPGVVIVSGDICVVFIVDVDINWATIGLLFIVLPPLVDKVVLIVSSINGEGVIERLAPDVDGDEQSL